MNKERDERGGREREWVEGKRRERGIHGLSQMTSLALPEDNRETTRHICAAKDPPQ